MYTELLCLLHHRELEAAPCTRWGPFPGMHHYAFAGDREDYAQRLHAAVAHLSSCPSALPHRHIFGSKPVVFAELCSSLQLHPEEAVKLVGVGIGVGLWSVVPPWALLGDRVAGDWDEQRTAKAFEQGIFGVLAAPAMVPKPMNGTLEWGEPEVYEILGHHDPYTIVARNESLAALAVMLLGNGMFGIPGSPRDGYGWPEWFVAQRVDPEVLVRDYRAEIAQCLATVMVGTPQQRMSYDLEAAPDTPDRRAAHHARTATVTDDLGLRAMFLREQMLLAWAKDREAMAKALPGLASQQTGAQQDGKGGAHAG